MLKKRRLQSGGGGFSFTFVLLVAVIGIVLGFLSKLLLSSPTSA